MVASTTSELSVVVLISGSGSNLQAIMDLADVNPRIRIGAVISSQAQAYGLQRATMSGIPTMVVAPAQYADREAYDRALQNCIDGFAPDLVALAGFMRILSDGFVNHYLGRMLNIHPSLLPKYRGLNTHQQVLEAGDTEHGASVHFVTPELDGGPIVIQARLSILTNDTAKSLARRVLEKEHQIFPLAIRWFAERRLSMQNGQAVLDGQILQQPVLYKDDTGSL